MAKTIAVALFVVAIAVAYVRFRTPAPAQEQGTAVAQGESTAASAEQPSAEAERIAVADLKQKLESGERMLLIDVRRDDELEADGAIEGAIHIPMDELEGRMADIPKDVQLVFY